MSEKSGKAPDRERPLQSNHNVHERLAAAGITLPTPLPTTYSYVPLAIHESIAYIAGQIPKRDFDTLFVSGQVGREVSLGQAQDAARLAVQQGIAWIDRLGGGLNNVARVLRIKVFVAADDSFYDISEVADAASDIIIQAFGDIGQHARSVIAVTRLPRNSPVLIEMTAALHVTPSQD